MVNKILKYFIGYKDDKEIRSLCIFFPEINIYKRYSDKTKCKHFLTKMKTFLINIRQFWKKLTIQQQQKWFLYNKKYLKVEKRFNSKESFQCFHVPVIFFDWVCRKDESYYPKVFLEKFIHKCLEKYKQFWFLGLWKILLKYKKAPFPEILEIYSGFLFSKI